VGGFGICSFGDLMDFLRIGFLKTGFFEIRIVDD
jgi:hypothetical protein